MFVNWLFMFVASNPKSNESNSISGSNSNQNKDLQSLANRFHLIAPTCSIELIYFILFFQVWRCLLFSSYEFGTIDLLLFRSEFVSFSYPVILCLFCVPCAVLPNRSLANELQRWTTRPGHQFSITFFCPRRKNFLFKIFRILNSQIF